ncbi:LLM class F420-dependent oxidoreductase [Williamsia sterculiae]|uniref:Alkanesulfonate monooxygenase n=1 Tax=Williamsia sterculiae TaxID=1344003 RepID=A0A1N7EYK8_9NOCA|nr:LLM class F420-dependent oxidoreductase [Williamsia sterculiae]SIR93122.1 alkanesulfonate monooxygenase [Williamsia sterculiae]
MDLRIFVEPQQGATYDDQLAVARTTERAGFSGFFRSDHFLAMGRDGAPGPTDSWVTLAGIARETERVRLGTLVTSATFRLPGPLAIAVAEVDQMSGGRVEFGYGAGWFADEHTAYGIPFADTTERFGRFEESLEIIAGLWETPLGETYSFRGRHFTVTDSPALPKPAQSPRPPIILGGAGKRRGAALAARFADEFNVAFSSVDETRAVFARVDAAIGQAGRDPGSLVRSAAQVVCAGPDEASVARRADAIGRRVDELRDNGLTGSAAEIVDKIGRYAETGATRLYLQVLDMIDLDHIEFIASEVIPQLG